MKSHLFTPIKIGGLELSNRIIIPPMCQYSATDGIANGWHTIHYGALSQSGAGLLIFEACAVSPEARISYADLGLWSDETEAALKNLVNTLKTWSTIPLSLQLAHAGRKAATLKPWEGAGTSKAHKWQIFAPSAIAYSDKYQTPAALTHEGIKKVKEDFKQAAKRARRINFDSIETHMAHGYLLHQFLSPISNKRDDEYGGSLENRMRLPLEIFKIVAEEFGGATGVRISGSDLVRGGWDIDEVVRLVKELQKLGCAYAHISSGGLSPDQSIAVGAGYQLEFAAKVKRETGIPTIAVGLITEPETAEAAIASNQADMVAIGRGALYDPRWGWHAAAKLGQTLAPSPQYLRCQPNTLKELFKK